MPMSWWAGASAAALIRPLHMLVQHHKTVCSFGDRLQRPRSVEIENLHLPSSCAAAHPMVFSAQMQGLVSKHTDSP